MFLPNLEKKIASVLFAFKLLFRSPCSGDNLLFLSYPFLSEKAAFIPARPVYTIPDRNFSHLCIVTFLSA